MGYGVHLITSSYLSCLHFSPPIFPTPKTTFFRVEVIQALRQDDNDLSNPPPVDVCILEALEIEMYFM